MTKDQSVKNVVSDSKDVAFSFRNNLDARRRSNLSNRRPCVGTVDVSA